VCFHCNIILLCFDHGAPLLFQRNKILGPLIAIALSRSTATTCFFVPAATTFVSYSTAIAFFFFSATATTSNEKDDSSLLQLKKQNQKHLVIHSSAPKQKQKFENIRPSLLQLKKQNTKLERLNYHFFNLKSRTES
jgi:hypothetical protein